MSACAEKTIILQSFPDFQGKEGEEREWHSLARVVFEHHVPEWPLQEIREFKKVVPKMTRKPGSAAHSRYHHRLVINFRERPSWALACCIKIMFGPWDELKVWAIGRHIVNAFPNHNCDSWAYPSGFVLGEVQEPDMEPDAEPERAKRKQVSDDQAAAVPKTDSSKAKRRRKADGALAAQVNGSEPTRRSQRAKANQTQSASSGQTVESSASSSNIKIEPGSQMPQRASEPSLNTNVTSRLLLPDILPSTEAPEATTENGAVKFRLFTAMYDELERLKGINGLLSLTRDSYVANVRKLMEERISLLKQHIKDLEGLE